MNSKISKKFYLDACIHKDGTFLVNPYELELSMNVKTEDFSEQNIALGRVCYLIDEAFDSCVFVDLLDIAAIENYKKAGIKVCSIPEGPYDQIVGLILMSKINAVTEHKLIVEEIQITSKSCDSLCFYISIDNSMGYDSPEYWWNQNSLSITDRNMKSSKKEKIVELNRGSIKDWDEIGLSWKPKAKSNANIVYIDSSNQTV